MFRKVNQNGSTVAQTKADIVLMAVKLGREIRMGAKG